MPDVAAGQSNAGNQKNYEEIAEFRLKLMMDSERRQKTTAGVSCGQSQHLKEVIKVQVTI